MPQSLLGGGAMQLPDLASLLSLPGARVEVSRELRYCEAFRCRTILFRPRAAGLASWTQCPVSGCLLYGELDTAATFTGDSVAWVYPDHRTALLGKFVRGKLVQAAPATVSYKHVSASGLLTLRFTREEGEPVLFCPASATQLGGQRLLEDRYEAAMTRLGPSHIHGAEDGLFTRVAVPPGTLLSFYHGLNVPYGCDYSQELYAFDEEKKLLQNVYKIRIDSNDTYYIDLPLEMGRDTSLYRASRGHKVNHSFKPNCRYRQMQHPRWGEIVGIFSSRALAAGEELLCNYGYTPDTHLVPAWYRQLWDKTHGS